MSILSHLASGIAKEENVATNGLAYLLEDDVARSSLRAFVKAFGGAIPDDALFSSQQGDHERGIPDLVAKDSEGRVVAILEGKFWAGLTKHQPVSYLGGLPDDGVLVFIVPAERLDYVWRTLVQRVADEGGSLDEVSSPASGRAGTVAGTGKVVVVVDWLALLRAARLAADTAVRPRLSADIAQLEGLCESVCSSGFTPLRPEELSSGVWRRVYPLGQLVDEIGKAVVDEKIATKDGRLSHEAGFTSLKIKLHGQEAWICFDASACSSNYPTPFWLLLWPAAKDKLVNFEVAEPRRLFKLNGQPYLALPVPVGVERDDLLKAVVEQVRLVAAMLAPSQASVAMPMRAGDADGSVGGIADSGSAEGEDRGAGPVSGA